MNMFKDGGRVKFNPIFEERLPEIGLRNRTAKDLIHGIIVKANWTGTGALIDFPYLGSSYIIPKAWMMLEERKGLSHPLTKIFQDEIPLDKTSKRVIFNISNEII